VSKLEFYARPLVAFDPSKKEHRRWFHEFMNYGGWGTCPVRFICPEESGSDLVKMITRQLVDFYIEKEFQKGKKLAQKGKKVVDTKPKRQYN
jgi:hypothetical protein